MRFGRTFYVPCCALLSIAPQFSSDCTCFILFVRIAQLVKKSSHRCFAQPVQSLIFSFGLRLSLPLGPKLTFRLGTSLSALTLLTNIIGLRLPKGEAVFAGVTVKVQGQALFAHRHHRHCHIDINVVYYIFIINYIFNMIFENEY